MLRINKFLTLLLLVALLVSACQPIVAQPQAIAPPLPAGGAIAQVNDIKMYYEISGEGEPLLLIHGAIGSTADFDEVLPAFHDAGFQTIAIDCRGRGRSTDSGQMLTYALMAEDAIALMDELGIEKASIAGQSDGAMIGLHMAIHFPERVDKLISYGANFNVGGLLPSNVAWLENLTQADMEAMFGEGYRQLAPDPDHLPVLLEQLRHMFLTQPDFTIADLMSIEAEVLVFDGEEEDTVRIEHAKQMAAAIPNASMVILPDTGHHLMYEDPETYLDYAIPFLTGELNASPDGKYAAVNGIEMYYEIRGEGEPLLLIHGAIGSTADFDEVIPAFVEAGYQTIAVDCRGRGRSTDSGAPLSYAQMASDMVALLDELGIDKAHIAGQSDGGTIGLHMAIHYPERVDKLVSYGGGFTTDGFTPGFIGMVQNMTLADFDAMTGDNYRRLAPDPDYLPVFLEKLRNLLLTGRNYTLAELMSIQAPVLVFDGEEDDNVRAEHARQLAAAIPHASAVILPDTGHYLMYEQPQVYLDTVLPFLAGELDAPPAGKYAAVNGVQIYYEIHGEGEPLLLMPSGMWSTADWAQLTEILSAEYQVIVMDARGRGRSTDSGQRLDFAVMADDAVALMDELEIAQAHIVGWADSAIIGMEMAMRYPVRVDKLVAYAPNYTVEGLTEEHRAWLKSLTMEDMFGFFEESYVRIAPAPDYLPVMLERLRAMYLTEPNYTLDDLRQITAPTLVLAGENDEFLVRAHLEELAAAMPNAELVFLPGLSHYAPFEDPVVWTDAVRTFLGEPTEVSAQPLPRFEPSDCVYPVLADTDAECGYLVVREDRTTPDSPTIRVHVIKYPSTSATPAPDPIIAVPGGPGASGSFYAWLFGLSPAAEAWRVERDVYGLETRGAMYAEPAFYCPETEADIAEFVGKSMAEDVAWTLDAYRACHDRLVSDGANFSAYGIFDIAGDIADLRTALGIGEVNVYGVSYGTLPAMVLMRDQPTWLRSVILDSIIPPDVAQAETMLTNMQEGLDAIFAACASDPACDAAYPDLETVFTELLAQLRQGPVAVTVTNEIGVEYTVTVDDVKFVHFVYDSIFVGDGFTALPAHLYAALKGDLQAPAEAWIGYVAGQHGSATPEAGAWARGLTYATECLQDGSITNIENVTEQYRQVAANPTLLDWALLYWGLETITPCEFWEVTPRDPNIAVEPVESDIPTLMLTGSFDTGTPPSLSREATEGLSDGFYYELPSAHGLLLTDCAIDLMTQFLADPTVAPDAGCIDEMTPNWVLPE